MVTESVEAGVLALLNPVFTIGSACIPAGPGDDGQLIDLLSSVTLSLILMIMFEETKLEAGVS